MCFICVFWNLPWEIWILNPESYIYYDMHMRTCNSIQNHFFIIKVYRNSPFHGQCYAFGYSELYLPVSTSSSIGNILTALRKPTALSLKHFFFWKTKQKWKTKTKLIFNLNIFFHYSFAKWKTFCTERCRLPYCTYLNWDSRDLLYRSRFNASYFSTQNLVLF